MYSENIQPESEVRESLPQGFISGKLPMTEDEGRSLTCCTLPVMSALDFNATIDNPVYS